MVDNEPPKFSRAVNLLVRALDIYFLVIIVDNLNIYHYVVLCFYPNALTSDEKLIFFFVNFFFFS